eukprot:6023158-Amphidinium_carterae.1
MPEQSCHGKQPPGAKNIPTLLYLDPVRRPLWSRSGRHVCHSHEGYTHQCSQGAGHMGQAVPVVTRIIEGVLLATTRTPKRELGAHGHPRESLVAAPWTQAVG